MKASEYFDKKAGSYEEERQSGFIGSLVKKEEVLAMQLLEPHKGESILDVGSGSGHYTMKIKESGAHPFGIDMAPAMVERLGEKGIPGEVLNIEERVPKKTFDKALCAGALEFMKDPGKGISNISKALQHDGVFVAIYPRRSLGGFLYKMFHLSHGIKIKSFSREMMKDMLEAAGFRMVEDIKADAIANVVKAIKE